MIAWMDRVWGLVSSNRRCGGCLEVWRRGFREDGDGELFCDELCESTMRAHRGLNNYDAPERAWKRGN